MAVPRVSRSSLVLFVICVILAISSGVAGLSQGEIDLVTGHTAYVRVVAPDLPRTASQAAPVDYGLAELREVFLFGVFDRTRPIAEGENQLVFAWAEGADDPRDDPTLRPTGDHARLRDRYGSLWTVYEFSYGAEPNHAYGVPIGRAQHADPTEGPLPDGVRAQDGAYNYAITYRLDKLYPHAFDADGRALPEHAGDATRTLSVVLGAGPAPQSLLSHDPAANGNMALFSKDAPLSLRA